MPRNPKLHTISLVDALVASMRNDVLDQVIEADIPLAETEIASLYGVSRPTAKAAITSLVLEGLLQRDANKSARVRRLASADIRDLYLVRGPLEGRAVEILAQRGLVPEQSREAVKLLAEMPRDAPRSRFVELDLSFHSGLVAAVESERLSRLYELVLGEMHLSMVQSREALGRDRIVDEHRQVLDAIESRDDKFAVELVRSHLSGACEELTSYSDSVHVLQ